MVTHEFDERANIELPAANGNDEAARRLGPQGKAALKNKGGLVAEQVLGLREDFEQATDAMRNHREDIEPGDAINIAARFFDTAAKIYTLKAMAA
jgi:hypothetical protein